MHPIKSIKATIEGLSAAFRQFLVTVDALRRSIERNSIAVDTLRAEQALLHSRLDHLVKDSAFLVRVKRQELNRAGHSAN